MMTTRTPGTVDTGAPTGATTTTPAETDLLDVAAAAVAAADALRSAASAARAADPGPTAFGAGAPGLLGSRCTTLHQTWSTALGARAGEAAGQADRFDDAARRLRAAAANYADAERAVQAEGRRIRAARPPAGPASQPGSAGSADSASSRPAGGS